jgi:hypothetical protein
MNGCKQVTSGTGVVALTNYTFWFDFNSHLGAPRFGSPVCCAPAPSVAPKNSFYFGSDSYIYPAPAGTAPKFTRQQLTRALAKQANGATTGPEEYLVISKGPGTGPTAPTHLMWVVRYDKPLLPGHFCGVVQSTDFRVRCPVNLDGEHLESFVFYDATTGLFDMTIQIDGSKVAPGHLTINQWAAQYMAARG